MNFSRDFKGWLISPGTETISSNQTDRFQSCFVWSKSQMVFSSL